MTNAVANPFGGFRKRTYRLGELASHLNALSSHMPRIYAIWIRKRMTPLLREEIMVAVARTNACRFCNFVHSQWALHEGLSRDELNRIGRTEGDGPDPAREQALSFAQALASQNFAPLPEEMEEEISKTLSMAEREDIETVARVMTVANRCANTVDAFLSRCKGSPSSHSRLVDELVIGSGFLLVYPLMMVVLALMQKRSPLSVFRDFAGSQEEFL